MRYIYTRVSTDKQESGLQVINLKEKYPDAVVFEETASGAKERPILTHLLTLLQPGDSLVVAALDRLGRRTKEVLTLIEDLQTRGVTLVSVREGVDYSTIAGRLVTQILVSVAEMERSLISERIRLALAAKKSQGIHCGRRPTYGPEVLSRIQELKAQGLSCRAIGAATGVSPTRVSELTRS